MADSIVNDLADMFPDTVDVQPGYLDGFGDFIASGAVVSPNCLIEGNVVLTRDTQGREVVSTMQVNVAGDYSLTVDGHRYTLPARYSPRSLLTAIGIEKASDENGAHHETIFFP